jgi:hypothetical protein
MQWYNSGSDATIMEDLSSTPQNNATVNTERDIFCGYKIVVYGLLLICGVCSCWEIAKEGHID